MGHVANIRICYVLYRFVLPLSLLAATIVRYNFFSFIYGCLMLISPLLEHPSPKTLKSHTGRFITACLVLTSITVLSQVVFQLFLVIFAARGNDINLVLANCTDLETALRHIGLQRIENVEPLVVVQTVLPDVIAFVSSLVVFICCRTLRLSRLQKNGASARISAFLSASIRGRPVLKADKAFWDMLGSVATVVVTAACGIVHPSLLSSLYFVVTLVVMTLWAAHVCDGRSNKRIWHWLRLGLLVYTAAYLVLVYVTQFHFAHEHLWIDEHLATGSTIERLLGLSHFIQFDCALPWKTILRRDLKITEFMNVAVLLLLYFILSYEIRTWRIKAMKRHIFASQDHGSRNIQMSGVREQVLLHKPNRSVSGSDSADDGSIIPEVLLYGMPSDVDGDIVSGCGVPAASGPKERSILHSISAYTMRQSYIGMLIVMMIWSITYHSWLTFVFLLAACCLWIMPQKQRLCLRWSPVVVFYAEALLILQYIYGFNLTSSELPHSVPESGHRMDEIGIAKYVYPAKDLAIKLGYTFMFWLTLRHFSKTCRDERQGCTNEIHMHSFGLGAIRDLAVPGQYDGELIKDIGHWLSELLTKYWLFVCAALFLLIAMQEPVIFHIVYMLLFLGFVFVLKISFKFWRLCTNAFLWLVIIYSMLILICIYTYQFDDIRYLWLNKTGLSTQELKNIGLTKFSTASLFVELLTPASFVTFIIIQLHCFQKEFLDMSHIDWFKRNGESAAREVDQLDETSGVTHIVMRQKSTASRVLHERRRGLTTITWKQRLFLKLLHLWRRLNHYGCKLSVVLWRALEVHMFKVVVFTVFACCVSEVCAANILPVLFVVIMMPFNRMHHTMSVLCMIWASIVILLKMIFHLDLISSAIMDTNCTRLHRELVNNSNALNLFNSSRDLNDTSELNLEFIERQSTWHMSNSAEYFGLQRTEHMARHIAGYVAVVLVIALESIVYYHQKQFHTKESKYPLRPGVIFGSVTRREADDGLLKCIKFFINYGFYKFGKEICFTMTMITMVVRLDVYSLVYGSFLGILLLLDRRRCCAVWPFYMVLLMLILFVEYLFCLGVPPNICWEYPWDEMVLNLKSYLYLPDDVPHYVYSPAPKKLLVDFFQFLFVCLQWHVFHMENSDSDTLELFGGGSNACIFKELRLKKENPYGDFMSCKKSYMDYIKTAVFFYSYWFTLMIVFITGTARISLFCMGYLLGCFICLWFGEDMLIKPINELVKMWIGLLVYCYLVILVKCVLQLIGCVFLKVSMSNCWIIQLFNIVCLHSGQNEEGFNEHVVDDVGLLWDAICFVFLLLMLRVCKSWYFQHVFTELKLNSDFSSVGADLINTNLLDRLKVQKEQEQQIVQNIKTKMDKIKERHAHFQPPGYKEPTDHYEVIRSGDKYMFEELSDEEDLDFSNSRPPEEPEFHEVDFGAVRSDWRHERHTVGPIQLINAALLGGTKEALNLCSGRVSAFSHRHPSIGGSSTPAGVSTPEPQVMGQGPSFTDGHVNCEICSVSVDDLSPIRQNDQLFDIIDTSPLKEESITLVSECTVERTEQACPPKSLLLASCSPLSQADSRPRSGDKLSPKRTTMAIVNSDSLPAVAEELPNEADDVFAGPEILSLVTSVEELETKVEETEGEGVLGEVPCAPAVNSLKVAWAFFVSIVDWATGQLFRISREYRSVSYILERHKLESKLKKQSFEAVQRELNTDEAQAALQQQYEKQNAEKEFHTSVHPILLFFIAFGEAMVSHSAVLCYFAMILNTLMSGSIMSLLFPISIFFWSMLSIPRPTKRYWVTIITYTEVIIIVKYFFQFSCFWWLDGDQESQEPLWFPRLIGIERRDMYAAYDFFLLFCLFLHRMVLKSHGLWKDGRNWNRQSSTNVEPSGLFTRTPVPAENEAENQGDLCREPVDEIKSRGARLCAPVYDFFHHMIAPKYIASRDVYAPMFFCDLITFLIVVFGYASFGPSAAGGTDVATVIKQNRVPFPFLAMLLAQFVLIIVDRALYLRKQVVGKFIFHIFLVILVHFWMFLVLPYVTERDFTNNVAAQMWYFTKCIYFALSCYQIRTGYPTRIVGNFLTKNYNYFTLVLFKGFLAVPFLLELRALMDWMWTDTTLGISSWLQMEDIYANIFVLKCARWAEKKLPTPRGLPRSSLTKYGLGGVVLFLLIFVIWFPLLLFSLSSSIYTPCPPVSVSISIKIGGYEPLISLSSQDQHISQIKHEQFRHLKSIYAKDSDSRGLAYLNAHSDEDIYHVEVFGSSASIWEISNPSQMQLRDDLIRNGSKIAITCAIAFSREPREGLTETVSEKFERILDHNRVEDREIMNLLARIINGTEEKSVTIPELFPRYLTIPSKGKVNQSVALYSKGLKYSSVLLTLHHDRLRMTKWWAVQEVITGKLLEHEMFKVETEVVHNYLTFVSFNERVPTGVLSLFDKYGIIGLYLSLVLVISKFVRLWTQGRTQRIMIDEMPSPDYVNKLCLQVYLARDSREFRLEEELFAKLLFLFRSPELLIRYSRPKWFAKSSRRRKTE